ncbi:butyrophilin subfamily 1 member A1-like [Scomber japonicus]|uniref:butyrophilin subfamily 1 member A1-like n=1 Tax=Scomber japonicus TaxID=13676 RepID=UPI0023051B6E|nr:butyrophilin subfamily 1 member A1-like [Scomber japonicus]
MKDNGTSNDKNSMMDCLKNGLILKSQLSYFTVLVFHHTVILLLLTNSCRGQSQEVGPPQQIVAFLGENIILPCNPQPAEDSVSKSLEWGRLDLVPRFVHVRSEGQDLLSDQNPSYTGRTSMPIEKLKHGDLSLTLSDVKVSDNGTYRCYIPSEGKTSTVQLVVGSVSSPVIVEINLNTSRVMLQCESKRWYPEPEVIWLDGEGNLLSAGPTETVRGSDGLYTVSRKVTVEKRHSNNFTCRVQQNNINQTRETHIDISADCLVIVSSFAARVIIVSAACFICTLTFLFVFWKLHQTKKEEKAKLDEEFQKNKEEQTDLEQIVNTVNEQRKELEKQRDQLKLDQDEIHKKCDEIEEKLQSVEKRTESDSVQRFFDLKEIIMEAKKSLRQRNVDSGKLVESTQSLLKDAGEMINKMEDRKKAVDNCIEKIRKQQQEI